MPVMDGLAGRPGSQLDNSSTSDQESMAAPNSGKTMILGSQIEQNFSTHHHCGPYAMDILVRHIARGASYDSDEQYNKRKLLDDYHALMLNELEASASRPLSSEDAVQIIFGPRGSGKSTLARALCERLAKKDLLAANFFFKRGHSDLGRRGLLISTIAYQLCKTIQATRSHIELAIYNDPAFIDSNLAVQLNQLIVQPLRKIRLEGDLSERPFAIVIDGLDQCEGRDAQAYILRTFAEAFHTAELPVRLLVFSRAVPHLMDVVAGMNVVGTCFVVSNTTTMYFKASLAVFVASITVCSASVALSKLARRTITPRTTGFHDGFFYTWWIDGMGNATYTNGLGGSHSVFWTTSGSNFFGGKRWSAASATRIVNYEGTFEPVGNAYPRLYGLNTKTWDDYYVLESYGTCSPVGSSRLKGTITCNGANYDIINVFRISQGLKPIIHHFYGVRNPKLPTAHVSGTIDFACHVAGWESFDMKLKSLDQHAQIMETRGYFSSCFSNGAICVRPSSSCELVNP
ncbi:glycosyl hydrolases family 11-domain-containing protein [Panaeolus papilionaceus]|nr:glycosyl hydrolases family 11-domain-containing protein [Panaeolus papilionaceus]